MAIIEDLVVADYGAFVGLKGRRIRVNVPDHKPVDAPLLHLRSVQIHTRSATVSAAALSACCEAGIPVHFIDSIDGNYATVLSSKLTTVVTSKRCQIAAASGPVGVAVSRQMAAGKIKSQAVNLRYLSRRLDNEMAQTFKLAESDLLAYAARLEGVEAETIDEVRTVIMGVEGNSARLYWQTLSLLIPEEYDWEGRSGRHATDPVNSLLNYGYGILYGEVQNALVIAGLEPYLGLLHTDRPGKPSLTLDLIEEFRAPIVDRTVVGLVNRNFIVMMDENYRLQRDVRRKFAEHILSRLNAQGIYHRKRYQLRSIIQMQARLLAAAFREESEYVSYTGG